MIPPKAYSYEEFPTAEDFRPGMKEITIRRDTIKIAYEANVAYDCYEGGPLTLQILKPYYEDERAASFPCIVYVQGSGWGVQNVYANVASLSDLAKKGYVVAVVQYRHSAVAPFPAQVIDTRTAIRFLRKNAALYNIDPGRFVIFGDSSGGHTSLMINITEGMEAFASAKHPEVSDHINVCVEFYGPTAIWEMNDVPSTMDHCGPDSPEGMLIGQKNVLENLDLAKATDPTAYLSPERKIAPILIFHGDKDPLVPFAQSVRLYDALEKNGKEFEFYKMHGGVHGGPAFWTDEILSLIDGFIRRHIDEA